MSYSPRVFRTSDWDRKHHNVQREIGISWPLPRWMIEAAKRCPEGAYVHWNTQADALTPNYGIREGSSVTVVLGGDGEISVYYFEDRKSSVGCTESMRLDLEDPLQRTRTIE